VYHQRSILKHHLNGTIMMFYVFCVLKPQYVVTVILQARICRLALSALILPLAFLSQVSNQKYTHKTRVLRCLLPHSAHSRNNLTPDIKPKVISTNFMKNIVDERCIRSPCPVDACPYITFHNNDQVSLDTSHGCGAPKIAAPETAWIALPVTHIPMQAVPSKHQIEHLEMPSPFREPLRKHLSAHQT